MTDNVRMGWEEYMCMKREQHWECREGKLRRALGIPLPGESSEQFDRIGEQDRVRAERSLVALEGEDGTTSPARGGGESRSPRSEESKTMVWKPTTKPGVAALILAVLAVLSYGAIMVSIAAFGGVETPVVGMFLGVLYILCGITGGVFAVLAIWKRHERSLLVYLALIPAALATFLVLGEILYLIVFVLTGRQIH
jgi:hypothetical protein